MKVAVIIPAAGSGNRFGGEKQFKLFRGKPLLSYSVDKFLKISLVKEIIIAVPEGQVEKICLIPMATWPRARPMTC